jgi:hypothetical protein
MMQKAKYTPLYAGLAEQRKSRVTGTVVSLYRNSEAGLFGANGRWSLVCEDHHTAVPFETKTNARRFMPVPHEWCDGCRKMTTD